MFSTSAFDGALDTLFSSPDRIWLEPHEEGDASDVIVQMDNGTVYTATFITFAYMKRQMELSYRVTKEIADTPAVRYAVFDTPHILVDELNLNVIEDTIDNLIALDVFECHFTRVTEDEELDNSPRTTNGGKLATQEVAAVVISDVLVTSG